MSSSAPGVEMFLTSDRVRFAEEAEERLREIGDAGESEVVHVIARREGLELSEDRVLDSPGEHQVAIEKRQSGGHLREGHAHLERDPSLLGQDAEVAERPQRLDERVEELPHDRILAGEVAVERVQTAGMRLVAVCELAFALRALPERAGDPRHDITPGGGELKIEN